MTMTWIIRRGEREKRRRGAIYWMLVLLLTSLVTSCGANEGILRSGKETQNASNSAPARSSIDIDIDEMRTANFKLIYVLRRKDGGAIDAEDRAVIKAQTDGVNRRIGSDNGKAFVVGSNAALPPDRLAAIYDRFAVENYSLPDAAATPDNSNVSK